uniref:Uncharacterized protein n=1 Tax=Steinernema glaseri TaxID=37863 RepID=A0A1I8AKT8_9BILA
MAGTDPSCRSSTTVSKKTISTTPVLQLQRGSPSTTEATISLTKRSPRLYQTEPTGPACLYPEPPPDLQSEAWEDVGGKQRRRTVSSNKLQFP